MDDHDLTIVKTFGKFVSETSEYSTGLPFSMFEIFARENFQQKILASYVHGFGRLPESPEKDDELHLKLVLRPGGFKANSLATPAPASATPASTAAAPSAPTPVLFPDDIPSDKSSPSQDADAPSDSIHKRIN